VNAVNYQYRAGPTAIDFRGTVLLPHAKGEAQVESKSGRTEIEARFDRLEPPARFGAEYLTYVLWAITPDGHARSLGELVANGSDKAHLRVTTDLQSFGLIVTAEPYFSVRLPSDVVVMENQVRPDTIGKAEPIVVRYDLLPRGSYIFNVPSGNEAVYRGPKLSMDRYEAVTAVYQAQNAIAIARSQGAAEFAPDIFSRAEGQWREAQTLNARQAGASLVVTAARQAAETAEDARAVALKHKQDAELAQARDQAAHEQQLRVAAEAQAQSAQAEVQRAQSEAAAERAARERVEAEAASQPASARPVVPPPVEERSADRIDPRQLDEQRQQQLRRTLIGEINGPLPARDTPSGLVVTVPDGYFHGDRLSGAIGGSVMRVANIVAAHPGLRVEVEGHTDSAATRAESVSYLRAMEVRDALARAGLRADVISVRGLGKTRPLASNATAAGREQNRRVEIVISGEPIGNLPSWDKPYALVPQR
jgi:outer membrane protein OmpA-like peptidoglycan-associated protein